MRDSDDSTQHHVVAIFHDSSHCVSSPQIPLNKHELLIAYIFQIIQHLVSTSRKLYFGG